jgi:hemoglobin-like flavoprotein
MNQAAKEVLGKSTALAPAAAAAAAAHVKHKALSPTTTKAVEAHTATAASRGHVKILAEELAEDLFRIRMTVRTDSASAAFPPGAVVECALVLVA